MSNITSSYIVFFGTLIFQCLLQSQLFEFVSVIIKMLFSKANHKFHCLTFYLEIQMLHYQTHILYKIKICESLNNLVLMNNFEYL